VSIETFYICYLVLSWDDCAVEIQKERMKWSVKEYVYVIRH